MNNYKDVNKEEYMRAMFIELVGQDAVEIPSKAKLIHDFVMGHPSKEPTDKQVLSLKEKSSTNVEISHVRKDGLLVTVNGLILIQSRKFAPLEGNKKGKKKKGKKK